MADKLVAMGEIDRRRVLEWAEAGPAFSFLIPYALMESTEELSAVL